jgi:hypothetical protein
MCNKKISISKFTTLLHHTLYHSALIKSRFTMAIMEKVQCFHFQIAEACSNSPDDNVVMRLEFLTPKRIGTECCL